MEDDSLTGAVIMFGILMCIFMALWVSDLLVTRGKWHQDAVSAGHAEWSVTTNGIVEWRWKTNCTRNAEISR